MIFPDFFLLLSRAKFLSEQLSEWPYPPENGQVESIAEVGSKKKVGNAFKKVFKVIRTVFFWPIFWTTVLGFSKRLIKWLSIFCVFQLGRVRDASPRMAHIVVVVILPHFIVGAFQTRAPGCA